MSEFEFFLRTVAKAFQFSSLNPDSHGACLIIIKEGQIPLLFEFDKQLLPNTILLSSPVTSITLNNRSELYEALLKENHRIEETLSIKPDEDLVYLHRRFHPEIPPEELEISLHAFIDQILKWRKEIEKIGSTPPSIDKIPAPPATIKLFPFS